MPSQGAFGSSYWMWLNLPYWPSVSIERTVASANNSIWWSNPGVTCYSEWVPAIFASRCKKSQSCTRLVPLLKGSVSGSQLRMKKKECLAFFFFFPPSSVYTVYASRWKQYLHCSRTHLLPGGHWMYNSMVLPEIRGTCSVLFSHPTVYNGVCFILVAYPQQSSHHFNWNSKLLWFSSFSSGMTQVCFWFFVFSHGHGVKITQEEIVPRFTLKRDSVPSTGDFARIKVERDQFEASRRISPSSDTRSCAAAVGVSLCATDAQSVSMQPPPRVPLRAHQPGGREGGAAPVPAGSACRSPSLGFWWRSRPALNTFECRAQLVSPVSALFFFCLQVYSKWPFCSAFRLFSSGFPFCSFLCSLFFFFGKHFQVHLSLALANVSFSLSACALDIDI